MNIPNMQHIVGVAPPKFRRPVPNAWRVLEHETGFEGSLVPYGEPGGLRVICSIDTMRDGSRWLHVSCSRENRLPSWDDLKRVKDEFIGRASEAIQVLPASRDYVNMHPYCLHLWSPEP